MEKIYIKTIGCKVNTYDSHALAHQFLKKGYSVVDSQKDADISIINSCSVTKNAEKEARYLLRRYQRENPAAKRIITGCYAQIESATLAEMEEVDFVVPNETKESLVDLIATNKRDTNFHQKIPVGTVPVKNNRQSHFKSSLTLFSESHSSQTRAFVKIQDGCNGFCSYCQIPYARGSSRSVLPEQVKNEVKRLVSTGVKEIVFTGIHIGDYGEDLEAFKGSKRPPFVILLEDILSDIPPARIRISSLEPAEFTPALAALMKNHAHVFCDHMHFPLQSGSDHILKKMNRQYDREGYYESIAMAREAFGNPFIGADIIPGFPGETEKDFTDTVEFIEKCEITALHVFPYSKRPNTAAAKMQDHLSADLVKERASQLRTYSSRAIAGYYKANIGRVLPVLWESKKDDQGRLTGKTPNYLTVAAPVSSLVIPGSITPVTLKGLLGSEKLLGTPFASH